MKIQSYRFIRILLSLMILIIAIYFLISQTEPTQSSIQPTSQSTKQPTTQYFQGMITKIIDGDTLVIDDTTIRLALVDSPEYYQEGYTEAKEFTSIICLIGSTAMIDVDKGQTTDKYNRTIAVVYCNDRNLNAELLVNNHATIDKIYCNVSEFKNDYWVNGC